ncbi:hypothetical protein M2263_002366 [Providencia alcalifaciens]|nr:hypothetical protein [Providencia alcalifaciens]
MMMLNIKERMDDVVRENGMRNAARKCHTELKKYDKLTDDITKKILSKHLPEFERALTPEKKLKYTPNMWLNHYVRTIDKEMNNG